MDQFVTTYRKDYLWPYVRTFGKKLIEPNLYPSPPKCTCYPPPPIENRHHEDYSLDTQDQDWSRIGPMGPLLDPKLYPVQVGKSPETNTMRQDQPNVFLRKLHEKYPFLYEVLQTAPEAELVSRVNRDRLQTTYQIDYCQMEDGPPDLMRSGGAGSGACADTVALPGDAYHFNARPIIHRPATISKLAAFQEKSSKCRGGQGGGGGAGGSGGGMGGGTGDSGLEIWSFNNTEYQDVISKTGGLIIRDRLHYHTPKVHAC